MNKKEKLISIALKYGGDYNKIKEAILKDEVATYQYVNSITIFDDDYPKSLLELKDPPFVLFYKGNKDLLKEEMIGVVGSRYPCVYAKEATKRLVLNNKDKVIVSGLAKGIDGIAHEYAYRTIGILGCGIDYIYPKVNYDLYKKIEKEGLLLSEYPFDVKPIANHFPFRNRIIAALSKEIYVLEVHLKSGTITTVNEALELGKDVKVLPFDIFNSRDVYNNHLIKEGALIIEYTDLFDKIEGHV